MTHGKEDKVEIQEVWNVAKGTYVKWRVDTGEVLASFSPETSPYPMGMMPLVVLPPLEEEKP